MSNFLFKNRLTSITACDIIITQSQTESEVRAMVTMTEKEKRIVILLKEALPKMSDFDKGYILGKVESMADKKKVQKCSKAV